MKIRNKIFVFGLVLVGVTTSVFEIRIIEAASFPSFAIDQESPQSSCSLRLSWTYNGGQDGDVFEIDRNTPFTANEQSTMLDNGDEDNIPLYSGTANDDYSMNDTYVSPGGTYQYKIFGWRGENYVQKFSNSISTIPINQPAAPSFTFFERTKDGWRVDLEWTMVNFNPIQYGQYEVWRAEAQGSSWEFGPFQLLTTITDGTTLYGDGGLSANVSYKYKIVARQSDLGCKSNDTLTMESLVVIIPTDVDDAIYTTYDFNTDIVTVSGIGYDDPGLFEIWRAEEGESLALIDTSIALAYYDYDDSTSPLGDNKTYLYKVRKCNGGICSAFSDEASVVIANAPQKPEVRFVYANYTSLPETGRAYLSWNNTFPGATYVVIRRNAIIGEEIRNIVEMGSTDPEAIIFYQDDDIPLGSVYDYTICANLSGGNDDNCTSVESILVKLNANIYRVLRGSAWALANFDSGQQHGIGWVSFNKADLDDVCNGDEPQDWCLNWEDNPVDYSVQIDEKGNFSGAAWASAVNDGGETVGWGWLSFNKGDLAECSDKANPNDCAAKMMNMNGGVCQGKGGNCEVRGWGRFIGAMDDIGSDWDGFVSLSDKPISQVGISRNFEEENTDMIALASSWGKLKTDFSNFALASMLDSAYDFVKDFVAAAYAAINPPPVEYSIFYQPLSKKVSGVGWGGAIVGWVAMNNDQDLNVDSDGDGNKTNDNDLDCADCNIRSVNRKPTIGDVRVEEGAPISGGSVWCQYVPWYAVKFKYKDPDKDLPYKAVVNFYQNNQSSVILSTTTLVNFNDCAVSTGKDFDWDCKVYIDDPLGLRKDEIGNLYPGYSYLGADILYDAEVSVYDGYGDEASNSDFMKKMSVLTTGNHYYPWVDFTFVPETAPDINAGEIVKFTDTTQDGLGVSVNYPPKNWHWKFTNGNTTNPDPTINGNTTAIFQSGGGWNATLTTKDEHLDGHASCSLTKNVDGTGGGGSGSVKRRIFRER